MESPRPAKPIHRPTPRLYLVTPPIEDASAFADMLSAALAAADIAAVLLRLAAADERSKINRVKVLAPVVQARGIALVLDGHPEIAARAGADGAHLTGIGALSAAISDLQPARIAGVGGLHNRHDAMLAGEAGADYVMFGEADEDGHRPSFAAVVERIEWWAEVFQPPCVGFAGGADEVAPLAAAGADFVALGGWIWTAAAGPAATIRAATADLMTREPVA